MELSFTPEEIIFLRDMTTRSLEQEKKELSYLHEGVRQGLDTESTDSFIESCHKHIHFLNALIEKLNVLARAQAFH